MSRVPFLYSGFWDAPLGVVVRYQGLLFYFLRELDEDLDEYETEYRVFLLPEISDNEIQSLWGKFVELSVAFLGHVPINKMGFVRPFTRSRDAADNDMSDEILDVLLARISNPEA